MWWGYTSDQNTATYVRTSYPPWGVWDSHGQSTRTNVRLTRLSRLESDDPALDVACRPTHRVSMPPTKVASRLALAVQAQTANTRTASFKGCPRAVTFDRQMGFARRSLRGWVPHRRRHHLDIDRFNAAPSQRAKSKSPILIRDQTAHGFTPVVNPACWSGRRRRVAKSSPNGEDFVSQQRDPHATGGFRKAKAVGFRRKCGTRLRRNVCRQGDTTDGAEGWARSRQSSYDGRRLLRCQSSPAKTT